MFPMRSKNLKKQNKIVHTLSVKESRIFIEMLQRWKLGGSKGDQHEVFL
jgi:hypothetical protein